MKLNISKKFIILIIPLFLLTLIIVREIISNVTQSNTIELEVEAAEETISQFKMIRAYYTNNVVSVVKNNSNLKIAMNHKNDNNSIPLPATMMLDISEIMSSKKTGNKLKLYSNFPFPNRANRVIDDFGKKAIAYLTENPSDAYVAQGVVSGQDVVRVAIGDFMISKACVDCHNNDPQSLKTDWKVGDMAGVFEVVSPIKKAIAGNNNLVSNITYTIVIALIIILIFLTWFMRKSVSKPIGYLAEAVEEVAKGDYSTTFDKKSNDEIGILTESFTKMTKNLQQTGIEVDLKTKEVEKAAEEANKAKEFLNSKNQYLDKSTTTLMTAMERFAEGDLTVQVKSEKNDDAIAKLFSSFNEAVQKMKQMILHITDAVEATASASTQISSSAEEMAAGSQEQSAQTGEIATAMEEMSSTILETNQNTSVAAEAAKDSGTLAEEGGEAVTATIAGMDKIAKVVLSASDTVKKLGENSEKIGEIIHVINDIADQTNLLALNAAIEAARAGEQGRGFAVVADEVRKLAERTTTATKEIAGMINQLQTGTTETVTSIEQGVQEVNTGKELAAKAGESIQEMVNSSTRVLDVITQVATASEEQAATAEEISKNIESINMVAQESAVGVEQIAKASEDLNRLTENLQQLVNQFKVNNDSGQQYLN